MLLALPSVAGAIVLLELSGFGAEAVPPVPEPVVVSSVVVVCLSADALPAPCSVSTAEAVELFGLFAALLSERCLNNHCPQHLLLPIVLQNLETGCLPVGLLSPIH